MGNPAVSPSWPGQQLQINITSRASFNLACTSFISLLIKLYLKVCLCFRNEWKNLKLKKLNFIFSRCLLFFRALVLYVWESSVRCLGVINFWLTWNQISDGAHIRQKDMGHLRQQIPICAVSRSLWQLVLPLFGKFRQQVEATEVLRKSDTLGETHGRKKCKSPKRGLTVASFRPRDNQEWTIKGPAVT